MMNSKLTKVIVVLLSVFAVIYFAFQIYQFFYTPYRTQIAELYEYTNEVDLNGIAIKEEQVIDGTYSGVLKYEYNNAQKVKAGAAVAIVYPSELDLVNSETADQLRSEIALLQMFEGDSGGISDAQNIHELIQREQTQLLYHIQRQEFSNLEDDSSSFLTQLLKQEKALNSQVSYQDEINRLTEQLNGLNAVEGTAVTTPIAGYFTSEVDGYESLLTTQVLENLSVESLEDLLENTKANSVENTIGKIVTSTEWYFAAMVKTSELENFSEGRKTTLIFDYNTSYQVSVTTDKIYKNPEGEYSVIVFRSNIMNEQIINLRKENAVAYFGSGRGLRVDREAIRMVDGQVGVYINSGQVARFRKLNVEYYGEDYVICSLEDDKEYLQLYDEIIIEGKDELYDNKPL